MPHLQCFFFLSKGRQSQRGVVRMVEDEVCLTWNVSESRGREPSLYWSQRSA